MLDFYVFLISLNFGFLNYKKKLYYLYRAKNYTVVTVVLLSSSTFRTKIQPYISSIYYYKKNAN